MAYVKCSFFWNVILIHLRSTVKNNNDFITASTRYFGVSNRQKAIKKTSSGLMGKFTVRKFIYLRAVFGNFYFL